MNTVLFQHRWCPVYVMLGLGLLNVPPAVGAPWDPGDVVVAVSYGAYQVRAPDGTLKETLNLGGGFTTMCAFNNERTELYLTYFSEFRLIVVDVEDPHAVVQTISTAIAGNTYPESVTFDAAGNFYVGHSSGSEDILKFDPSGTFVAAFDVETGSNGSCDIDLSSDQRTMFYTSEGRRILRYDVVADTQLADFTMLPGAGEAFVLRLLPPGDGTGGLLVADELEIKRLDGSGSVVQTYDAAGEDRWFALNLDPDGLTFWAADLITANLYRFEIDSGAIVSGPVNTGSGISSVYGLCVLPGNEPAAATVEVPALGRVGLLALAAAIALVGWTVLLRRDRLGANLTPRDP